MTPEFTPEERNNLRPDDLVVIGRGRTIWRVAGFWRSTAQGMVFASLVRTDRPDVRQSRDPLQCRPLGGKPLS